MKPEQQKARKEKTKTALGFVIQYRAGNIRDVELFSIGTEDDTASETATVIEEPYYVFVRVRPCL